MAEAEVTKSAKVAAEPAVVLGVPAASAPPAAPAPTPASDPTRTFYPEKGATVGTHVVFGTSITFTDVKGNRTHAKEGDYVSPCAEDLKGFLKQRLLKSAKAYEAELADKAAQLAAEKDL